VKRDKHQVFLYPASRIATIDLGQIALRKHHIAGLLEVDVTNSLTRLKERGDAKGGASFFAWIVKVIATVIAENCYIHAVFWSKKRTIVFDDIDISIVVERKVEGGRVPLPLVIRRVRWYPPRLDHSQGDA
jgi:hypothetical protein